MVLDSIRELIRYEPETGMFYWLKYRGGNAKPGRVAGTTNAAGYVQITVNCKLYYAHRLAWLFSHGEMPDFEIDHRDGDPSNNRISNLRPATASQQKFNTKIRKNSSTGVKGVSYDSQRGKFMARVKTEGVYVLRKRFDSLEEAETAVRNTRKSSHQDFANHGG